MPRTGKGKEQAAPSASPSLEHNYLRALRILSTTLSTAAEACDLAAYLLYYRPRPRVGPASSSSSSSSLASAPAAAKAGGSFSLGLGLGLRTPFSSSSSSGGAGAAPPTLSSMGALSAWRFSRRRRIRLQRMSIW